MHENDIGTMVVMEAIRIHRGLGPGLLESVYEAVLARALEKRGMKVQRQVPIAITFDGESFDIGFRADLLVEDKVILELKSVEETLPVHRKQTLTYIRLSGKRVGYLLNFGAPLMKDGIVRLIHGTLEATAPCLRASACLAEVPAQAVRRRVRDLSLPHGEPPRTAWM